MPLHPRVPAPMRTGARSPDDPSMSRTALIASLVAVVACSGCGSSGDRASNKAGASAATPSRVLDLQASDPASPEAQYFARRVAARSGGALTVRVRGDYPAGTPANEARLARDLRAGRVGFGMLPARAWAPAGVRAFDALLAPLVLGDYDVARTAVAGPAGGALKADLTRAGLVALALVPAELRRVFSLRPLRTVAAFRAVRVRVPDNPTAAAVLRALGATPVQGLTNTQTADKLRDRALDGTETAPIWAINNGYGALAPNVTDFAVYDRVDTVVATPAAWKRLSVAQQTAIRAAARDTTGYAATLTGRDARNLAQLCRGGARVTAISKAQLDAVARATEPVRVALRRDPETGPILAKLEATAGAGPRLLPVSDACARPVPSASGARTAKIPNGTYRVRTTVADLQRGGNYGPDWEKPIVWTIRLSDGRFDFSQKPDYPDAGPGSGTFTVKGDVARFRILKPAVDANPPWTARWSYYQGLLTWVPLDIADPGLRTVWGAHPWRKVR